MAGEQVPAAASSWQTLVGLLRSSGDRARSKRHAVLAFGVRVGSAGLLFLSQILLARWMGSFEYGIYAYVWVWIVILGPLMTLGFNNSVVRFIPEYRETGEAGLLRGLIAGSRLTALAVSTIASLAGMALLFAFDGLVETYYLVPFVLALLCLPMYALTDLQDGIGRAQSWFGLALIPPYIMRPLLALGVLVGAVLLGYQADAKVALIGMLVATWLTAGGQYLLLRRRLGATVTRGSWSFRFGPWLKVSLPLLVLDGSALLLQSIDVIVLEIFTDPTEVAHYFAAAKTASLIAFVHFAVAAVSWTRFSEHQAAGRNTELARLVHDVAQWTFWPSLAIAIIVLALGIPLLWLFGPDFIQAYPIMFVLAAGLLARASVGPAQGLLNMLGYQNACAVILIGTVVANVVLNFLLIPRFGLLGAAAATSIAFMIESMLLFVAVKRLLGFHSFVLGGEPLRHAKGRAAVPQPASGA